jgi:hypothetical protein
MKRYLFTDGHNKIRTIKYQTESPKISVVGRGRFGLENRMVSWADERVWVRIVLECFMFFEGGVPATKIINVASPPRHHGRSARHMINKQKETFLRINTVKAERGSK